MSTRYTVTCSCGQTHPVEISQAGADLPCSCGATVKVPSMLKLKKLPLWQEEESQPRVAEPVVAAGQTVRISPLAGNRLGILLVGVLLTAACAFFLYRHVSRPPMLVQVFFKQTSFASGDTIVRRNSSPVTQEDYDFFLLRDPGTNQTYIINDSVIDVMAPFVAYTYFDVLRNGLDLSDNFKDNFDDIRNLHRIATWAWTLGLCISVLVCAVPWLLPRRQRTVGAIRGAQWTK
ncbi:MAG: hypothetical protein Q4G68_11125 [Planctomycetia bacterium]|nr:hypothetical protein [Planctomycetia bacterium]